MEIDFFKNYEVAVQDNDNEQTLDLEFVITNCFFLQFFGVITYSF